MSTSMPLSAVCVSGFNETVTEEELELFFESPKRTGGRDIVGLRVDRTCNVAIIDYGSVEVARAVAEHQQLTLKGFLLSVIRCSPNYEISSCDPMRVDETQDESVEKENLQGSETSYNAAQRFTNADEEATSVMNCENKEHHTEQSEVKQGNVFDSNKVFVRNIAECVTYDGLLNYMESKSKCEVDGICFGAHPGNAIISFKEKPDIPTLQSRCTTRPLEGSTLDVEYVKRCSSVQVHDLPEGCTQDALWNYFETRRSGGDEVEDVRMFEGCSFAVVTFKDPSVVDRVLLKPQHSINSTEIKVSSFYEQNGCRHPKDDLSKPLPRISPEVRVGPLDEDVMSYILDRDCVRCSISNDLEKVNAVVLWDSCTNDTLIISSTLKATSPDVVALSTNWKNNVNEAIASLLALYDTKETIVSKKVLGKRSGKLEVCDNKAIQINVNPCKGNDEQLLVRITGPKELVDNAVRTLATQTASQITECVEKVKECETYYLKEIGFETLLSGCMVDSTSNEVKFLGSMEHVTRAKARKYEELHSLTSTKVVLSPECVELLSKQECSDYISRQLNEAGVKVAWRVSGGDIELYSNSEDRVKDAANMLTEELCQESLMIPAGMKCAFQEPAWFEMKTELHNKYTNLVQIAEDRDNGVLTVTSTRPVLHDVKTALQDYINRTGSTQTSTEQKSKEGEAPSQQNTVKVSGFGATTHPEAIELFFEDLETSGGGDIKRLTFDDVNGVAVIEFEESCVAQRILENKALVFNDCKLVANLHTEDQPTDVNVALRVTGFDQSTTDEMLKMFFKNRKKSGGFDLKSLRVNQWRTAALVVYESAEVAELVASKPELKLQGKLLSAELCSTIDDIEIYDEEYLSMTAVRVTGFHHTTSNDTLGLFFANKQKSGGGQVKLAKVNKRRTAALIDYGCRHVAQRVAGREVLQLDDSILSAVLCRPDEDIDSTPSISRAALGRIAKIGNLYDIRSDNVLDQSLFREEVDSSSICLTQLNETSLEEIDMCDLHNQLEKLNVDPELQLSVLTELSNVKTKSGGKQRLSTTNLIFKKESVKEEYIISQNQDKIDFDIINFVADQQISATHVILGVVWGTLCTLTPEATKGQNGGRLKEEEIKQLRNILCRQNKNDATRGTIGFWRSSIVNCKWDLFLPYDGSLANTRFQGINEVICNLPQVAGGKKRAPLVYLLMPLEEVAALCDMAVTMPPFFPIGARTVNLILTFLKNISEKRLRILQIQSDLKSSKNYVADQVLANTDSVVVKHQGDMDAFKNKLRHMILIIRKQNGDTSYVEDFLHASHQDLSTEVDKQISLLAQEFEKLQFIKSSRGKGILYVGKNDQFSVGDAPKVYIFYKPAKTSARAEKVERFFLRCQSSQSLRSAIFKVVDETIRPDLWRGKEEAAVAFYQKGIQQSKDVYADEYKELEKCLVKCKDSSKATFTEVEEKAYVKLRCPNALSRSGVCSGYPLTWTCAKCDAILEYGFKSKSFYCKCGLSKPFTCQFRCNEFEHGVDYLSFPDDLLRDELASLSETKEKTILILGETGVGKSTWINSIFNYLTFPDLNAAMKSEELQSLIPSRFTFTKDGNSCEVKTKDTSSNEVRESGQSATQGAQSYVFKVGDQKIRLIDTPGVGDSRGIDQDRQNFDNILGHLSKYDEIHAVCILLKPNNSRLTVVFKFCIQELLARLHPSAKQNIVFCFTNARATFYQPGDTLPALNKMLQSKNIGMQATPENYFCFDNEPFRFLVCLHNDIKFEETEITTYSASWDKAVSETNKLFHKIKSMAPHKVRNTISMNEARRIIVAMSKPMAEVATSIQENVQLANDAKEQIDLHDQTMHDLQQSLKFSGYDLKRNELPYPMTVCSDSSCIERVPVGDANINMINYTQICHAPCSLRGIPIETINDERLKACACIRGTFCQHCNHHYTQHMHLTYTLEKVQREFIAEDVQNEILNKKSEKEKKAMFKESVDRKVHQLTEEEKTILQVSAKYGAFLKNNCIIPYNDAVGDYIDMSIDQEDKKPGEIRNEEMLKRLKTLRREYDHEKKILDNSLKEGYTTSPAEVMELQKQLFQLKHFGKTLQGIFEGISISGSAKGKNEDEIIAPFIHPVTRRYGNEIGYNDSNGEPSLSSYSQFTTGSIWRGAYGRVEPLRPLYDQRYYLGGDKGGPAVHDQYGGSPFGSSYDFPQRWRFGSSDGYLYTLQYHDPCWNRGVADRPVDPCLYSHNVPLDYHHRPHSQSRAVYYDTGYGNEQFSSFNLRYSGYAGTQQNESDSGVHRSNNRKKKKKAKKQGSGILNWAASKLGYDPK